MRWFIPDLDPWRIISGCWELGRETDLMTGSIDFGVTSFERSAAVIEPMTQARPYYFMLTFWGEKYRDFFYSMCLPTLLAPNNLPVLKTRPGSKLIICTTKEDWAALSSRPLVQR